MREKNDVIMKEADKGSEVVIIDKTTEQKPRKYKRMKATIK